MIGITTIIGIILVVAWFASSAVKRGFNPILWGVLGAVCYIVSTIIASLLVVLILKFLPIPLDIKFFIQTTLLVGNMIFGFVFCYWVGRLFGFKAN